MPHIVTHLVRSDVLVLPEIVVEFSPWIGVRDRYLDRFTIELLSKLHSTLNGLGRFPRQPDDKIPMHHKTELFTIFHEAMGLLDSGTFLDVFKDLRITRLKAYNQQTAPRLLHRFERVVVRMHPRRA